jgi:hypothetical protein
MFSADFPFQAHITAHLFVSYQVAGKCSTMHSLLSPKLATIDVPLAPADLPESLVGITPT